MRLSGTVMKIWHLKSMYTDTHTERRTHNDGQNDQSHNLLQCSLRSHLAKIINKKSIVYRPTFDGCSRSVQQGQEGRQRQNTPAAGTPPAPPCDETPLQHQRKTASPSCNVSATTVAIAAASDGQQLDRKLFVNRRFKSCLHIVKFHHTSTMSLQYRVKYKSEVNTGENT